MNQTSTTDPPIPPHADKSCPRCGCTTLKRVARRIGGGWSDFLQCTDCGEAVGPLPRPRKPAPELAPMPAGELNVATLAYTGWHRAGKSAKWRAIVTAATEDEALAALLDAATGGDKVVLAAVRDPNRRDARS